MCCPQYNPPTAVVVMLLIACLSLDACWPIFVCVLKFANTYSQCIMIDCPSMASQAPSHYMEALHAPGYCNMPSQASSTSLGACLQKDMQTFCLSSCKHRTGRTVSSTLPCLRLPLVLCKVACRLGKGPVAGIAQLGCNIYTLVHGLR